MSEAIYGFPRTALHLQSIAFQVLVNLSPSGDTYMQNGLCSSRGYAAVRTIGLVLVSLATTGCGGSDSYSAEEKAEDRRRGTHCTIGGFNDDFVEVVKRGLRDPNSFEHDETRVGPVQADGRHVIAMYFRARNGFGGMNRQLAIGSMTNDTCRVTLTMLEQDGR